MKLLVSNNIRFGFMRIRKGSFAETEGKEVTNFF